MKLYILNEKEYIRDILASKKKPDDLPMGYFITLTAKYYLSDNIDVESLSKIIKEKLAIFAKSFEKGGNDLAEDKKKDEEIIEELKR